MSAIQNLLGDTVIKNSASGVETINVSDIAGDTTIGLYFSAHWCPPCRQFTPMLVELYNKVKSQGKKLEVIFISSDRDAAGFSDYFGSMPWLALPFDDRDRKNKLCTDFEIRGIPSFIILDKDGKAKIRDGRGCVAGDPNGEKFPWETK